MLQLYDLNKIKIQGLTKYRDMNIESILSTGDKTLSFLYPAKLTQGIKEEGYIRTKTDEFVIKEITDNKEWKSIKATLNIEALEGQPWEHFDTTEKTITECLTLALAGTGWTIGTCNVTKRRTVRKTNCSSWDIIQQAKKTYRVEIEFDTLNKKINISEKLGGDKGVYFMDSLNLKNLDIQSNSYDFYTRIIAIGKDDLKVTVENYQYSNKKKTLIWKDERYTVLESLREDATAKLEELSKPYKAYGADIIDLASISNKYSILSYGLGDTITLISKEKGIREKQRIVKITEFPEEPERNTCEIANTLLRFEDIQKEQQDTTDTVNNITTDNGTVDGSAINSIKTEQISDFEVSVGKITNFTAINARIDNLYVKKADIDSLNAVEIRVGNLIATKANITDLDAEVARINQAFIKTATIENLNATNGKITLLETKVGSIDTVLSKNIATVELIAKDVIAVKTTTVELNTGLANVSKLVATKAEIADLLATNATISTLDTKVGTIDNLVNGNLTSANMKAGSIKAGDAIIADGAISNAQIINLDVAKINAGNISTNKFTVGSDSGNLQIKDNTLKVWDKNKKERVSLGLNGADYNLLIRGTDGNTVLFGTDGVTNAGITKGAVDNSKVADNANISGSKIEKESLVTTINGATTTLKSSRVKIDDVGQTLDIAFKNLRDTVTTTGNTVSSQGTSLKAVQGQITSKVWQADIDTSLSSTNTEIVNIKDKYALQEQTINGFKTTIADTNTRLDTTNNNVLSVDNKVATVNKTIDGITSNITNIKKDYVTNADASTTYTTNVKTNALEQSINGLSSTLTDVKSTTLTKADASVTYATNIKTNALEQTINGFSTRVGSVETTTTAQGKTIASHTGSISAMDNAIKLKVDNQTFNTFKTATDGNISTINTSLNKATSSIDVLQKSINLKVSQTEIDNSINNIDIGGRNLVSDTNNEFTNKPGPYGEFVTLPYDFTPIFEEYGVDKTYTISFDLTSKDITNNDEVSVYPYPSAPNPNKYGFPRTGFKVTEKYQRFSITFVPQIINLQNVTSKMVVYGSYGTGNIPSIRRIKLEKGNKATDWTPAPEDTIKEIEDSKTKAIEEANANSDKIRLELTKNINAVTLDIANMSNDNILSKVDKSQIKKEWEIIVSEYPKTLSQANKYGIAVTAYTSSYNVLNSYITPLLSNMAVDTAIDGNLFRTNFKNYYDQKIIVNNLLLDKAKADAINVASEDAKTKSAKALADSITYTGGQIAPIVTRVTNNESGIEILKKSINLKVSQTDIDNSINAINIGGRNLILDSAIEWKSSGREYITTFDLAPIFELHGLDKRYSLSMDIKTTSMQGLTTVVYMQNGNGTKYSFVDIQVGVGTEYRRIKFEGIKPTLINDKESKAMLSFYGGYGTGNFPVVKNIKLELGTKATDWTPAPEDTIKKIEDSKTKAIEEANKVTEKAKVDLNASINTINGAIANMANDNVLSKIDKSQIKKEWEIIVTEYPKLLAQANKYSTSVTAYTNAYNTLNGYITPLLSTMAVDTPIDGTVFRTNFKNYYNEKLIVNNILLDKAKADAIGLAEVDAKNKADKALADSKGYTNGQITTVDTKINNKVSEINLTLDGVSTRVGKTESTSALIDGKVTDLSTRVLNAEQKITPEGIVATVTNSTAYKTDLNGKASTTDLTNAQSSISQLSNKIDSNVAETSTIKGVVTSHTSSITQLTTDISQKVSVGEFGTKFSQTAASFEFAIGQTGKNTIYIDKNGLVIRHGGSWTHGSSDGLYHYDAAGHRGYHYLFYQGIVFIPAGVVYQRISLPADFKSKDFYVTTTICTINNVGDGWALKSWDTGWQDKGLDPPAFTIKGNMNVENWRLDGLRTNIDVGVFYTVTA
ncbi:phage tail spike protein [Clostridium algidicarnis]|uniref:phage tail spike protein n=1 Tax=Clostridium algidicarnis TaxID=37659 RepID=UPI001FEB1B86|nr:phage tail spike protein [Clostridium algidicarnis]